MHYRPTYIVDRVYLQISGSISAFGDMQSTMKTPAEMTEYKYIYCQRVKITQPNWYLLFHFNELKIFN